MQNQQSNPYLNISGLNLGGESVGSYGSSGVPLPLPSKNPLRAERIISTLIRESEAITSNTQFNFPSTNRKTSHDTKPSDLQRSSTVVKHEIRDLPSVNKGEFESKLLGSPNVGIADRMNCATMFDKQYLILGSDTGLFVIDFSIHWEMMRPKQLIRGCSFKKLQVLDDYGVMIAITGKKQTIRIYKLDSLLHLIKFVVNSKSGIPVDFSKASPLLKKMTDCLPKCEVCGHHLDEVTAGDRKRDLICSSCIGTRDDPDSNTDESSTTQSSAALPPGKSHRRQLSNISKHFIQHNLSNSIDSADISVEEKSTVWSWATDYEKLQEVNKFCVTFDIKETKSHVYLTVLTINHSILLFSCSVESKHKADCKFEYLNAYFVPVTPNFISVSTDSYIVKQIIAGVEDCKVIVIDCHTSTVTELNMAKHLVPRYVESPRWMSFTPVPYSCSPNFLSFSSEPPKAPQTLASQTTPTQHSLETPNFPNSSNMLSRASSSYSGLEKRNSRSRSSPVPPTENQFSFKSTSTSNSSNENGSDSDDDSQASPRNSIELSPFSENAFICTISNVSHIVNIRAELYSYSCPIRWTSEPNRISLLPTIDDLLIIAFEDQLVEVGSAKTGKIVKTAASGAPVKYLGESWRNPVPQKGRHKQKKYKFDEGIKRYVFWSCEMGDEIYIYRGDVFGIN